MGMMAKRYYVRGRIEEGDQVLSALHDLPIDDAHVQAQRTQIFEAIEIESSQKPFNVMTLFWDNTGRVFLSHFLLQKLSYPSN